MHLIDDIHLISSLRRTVGYLFPDLTDIVHTVVGSRIHLHHVQNAAVIDALADLTLAAGVSIDRMQAVDCLCKDLGAGGFAGAADAGKQVGMAHTVCRDLVFSRSTMARWPTTSSKRCGLHLRYKARYMVLSLSCK